MEELKNFIIEDNVDKNFAYLIILEKEEKIFKIQNCILKTKKRLPGEYTEEDILEDLKKEIKIKNIIDLYSIKHFEY